MKSGTLMYWQKCSIPPKYDYLDMSIDKIIDNYEEL